MQKRFQGAKMIQTSPIRSGGFTPRGGILGQKVQCFFFLPSCFLNGKIYEHDFVIKPFELEISFDTTG